MMAKKRPVKGLFLDLERAFKGATPAQRPFWEVCPAPPPPSPSRVLSFGAMFGDLDQEQHASPSPLLPVSIPPFSGHSLNLHLIDPLPDGRAATALATETRTGPALFSALEVRSTRGSKER